MTATATNLESWLDAVHTQSSALVLEGPAGIGKTHRWREIVASAAPACRVLRAHPAQSETRLVASALIDLCDDVGDDEIAELPGMQAAALTAALLRATDATTPNPHAVALAFTTLVRRSAEHRPTLICIDDIQWLDAQTAQVIAFAARRLPPAGAGLLLALRTEPGVAAPELVTDIAAALPFARWRVPALTPTELEQIVRARIGGALPGGVLRAAVSSAAGNPMFGIEVARAMMSHDRDSADPVHLPQSLSELVGRHVTDLPEATRLALATAAALGRPSLRHLRTLGVADSLDPAVRAGLVRVEGHHVSFSHPLYAAAAYDGLGTAERMRLHTRLAGVVQGAEERARHLALGADEPDEAVAEALDVARDRALGRGAFDAALGACQLALRATPTDSPMLAPRRRRYGHLLFRAGETERAKDELGRAAEQARDPLERARALHALARVVNDTEGPQPATPLELEALGLAGDDVDLTADIHMGLAISNFGDWEVALAHARTACALLERADHPDDLRIAEALTAQLGPLFYTGGGADLDTCRRAIALQGSDTSAPVSDRAMSVLFYLLMWTDDLAGAREQMDVVLKHCVEEGDEPSRCYLLACRAQLEVRAGRWDEADRLIDECAALAETSQNSYYEAVMAGQRAWLAAYRGDLATGIEAATGYVETGVETGNAMLEQRGRALLGFCELARDDVRAAVDHFERYVQLFASNNAAEPALRQQAGDHVEALIAVGRVDDAERALAVMVEPATRLGRTAVLAAAARVEALLHVERGDGEAALAAAERSLALYDTLERRFDRARALLTKGQIHRRLKQKSLARRDLTAALESFQSLGAAAFAARTRGELSRVGLRPPAASDLTETERRIAQLTATGMTSAEVGKTLFLSTKTVSSNLTRIYRKLNVRNRAELTAALSARQWALVSGEGPPAS